jgi:hypothetical protein
MAFGDCPVSASPNSSFPMYPTLFEITIVSPAFFFAWYPYPLGDGLLPGRIRPTFGSAIRPQRRPLPSIVAARSSLGGM